MVDVAVGDRHIVALQRATGRRGDKRLDISACQPIRTEGPKIVHVRGHYSDQYALDAFWTPGQRTGAAGGQPWLSSMVR